MDTKKIEMKAISNNENFNIVTLEKSELFLDKLQDFLLEIGLSSLEEKTRTGPDGKEYDLDVYWDLFYEDETDDFKDKRIKINEFKDGTILRYYNDDIEMLIIFLENAIKLVFYCDLSLREKVINALLKFCEFKTEKQ